MATVKWEICLFGKMRVLCNGKEFEVNSAVEELAPGKLHKLLAYVAAGEVKHIQTHVLKKYATKNDTTYLYGTQCLWKGLVLEEDDEVFIDDDAVVDTRSFSQLYTDAEFASHWYSKLLIFEQIIQVYSAHFLDFVPDAKKQVSDPDGTDLDKELNNWRNRYKAKAKSVFERLHAIYISIKEADNATKLRKRAKNLFADDEVNWKRANISPSSKHQDSNGVGVRFMPAGIFAMGRDVDTSRIEASIKDEEPLHQVTVMRFWIDESPVTNARFKQFYDEDCYRNPAYWTEDGWLLVQRGDIKYKDFQQGEEEKARVDITWYEADAYAKWRGGYLPTEAQWEYAAKTAKDFQSGDVSQWLSTCYAVYTDEALHDPDEIQREENRQAPCGGRVHRGGNRHDSTTYRAYLLPEMRDDSIGFRCAYDNPIFQKR